MKHKAASLALSTFCSSSALQVTSHLGRCLARCRRLPADHRPGLACCIQLWKHGATVRLKKALLAVNYGSFSACMRLERRQAAALPYRNMPTGGKQPSNTIHRAYISPGDAPLKVKLGILSFSRASVSTVAAHSTYASRLIRLPRTFLDLQPYPVTG